MTRNVILLFSFMLIGYMKGQSPLSIQWSFAFGGPGGDRASSGIQTSDGGYIFTGHTDANGADVSGVLGGFDIWVVKVSPDGTSEWMKTLGGSGNEMSYAICESIDGHYMIAGYTTSNNGDVSGNHGFSDGWLVKLDYDGSLVWQRAYGGSDVDAFYDIQVMPDGGYIVVGRSFSSDGDASSNQGACDMWVLRLGADGEIMWEGSYGGPGLDIADSVYPLGDDGFIVAGSTTANGGDVTGHHGDSDYWMIKLDATGQLEWQRSMGGTQYDQANSIRPTVDAGYIVVGFANSTDGDVLGQHGGFSGDYWVVKLDADGAVAWKRCFGGSANDQATAVVVMEDGGFLVSGSSSSIDGDVIANLGSNDAWIVNISADGDLLWQHNFGGPINDYPFDLRHCSDDGLLLCGLSGSTTGDVPTNNGSVDMWILRLNMTGTGLSELNSPSIRAFPVPWRDVLMISVDMPVPASQQIELFDIAGTRVAVLSDPTIMAGQTNYVYGGSGLAPGMYFLRAVPSDGSIAIKVIKE